ncbi:follistatin-like isoform X2 [Oratosquilla oratoria]|uniref:follistatin-like isoform X2 n=1 Tax=Oratosquilla oratoria TaxID=337810 RepID=UPI003F76B2E9
MTAPRGEEEEEEEEEEEGGGGGEGEEEKIRVKNRNSGTINRRGNPAELDVMGSKEQFPAADCGNARIAAAATSLRLLAATTLVAILAVTGAVPLTTPTVTVTSDDPVGSCWRVARQDGACRRAVSWSATRSECCGRRRVLAWSAHVGDGTGNNSALSHGHTCTPCYPSCAGVRCGEDRKCVVRGGVPRCVCSPKCHLKHKSAVCGSDGRTYTSECHLLKRACRKKKRGHVAHYGPCQTCNGVRCAEGKTCVLDEKLIPRCRRCPPTCQTEAKTAAGAATTAEAVDGVEATTMPPRPRPLCGTDGVTYASRCHLKQASCARGADIQQAYKGACKRGATCSNVRCGRQQKCLSDFGSGAPVCVRCTTPRDCQLAPNHVCASDGSFYPSWCALHHEACRTGRALHPMPLAYCRTHNKTKTNPEDCINSRNNNTVPGSSGSSSSSSSSSSSPNKENSSGKHSGSSTDTTNNSPTSGKNSSFKTNNKHKNRTTASDISGRDAKILQRQQRKKNRRRSRRKERRNRKKSRREEASKGGREREKETRGNGK